MHKPGNSFFASLLLTLAFFIEYTGLWRRAHIPFDLEGYHYSLAQSAFDSLRNGEFPLWDPFIYSGTPLAANLQAALFYPLTWVMLGANLASSRLPFSSLEYFVVAHFAIGFWIAFQWLARAHRLSFIASISGAALFAFSGFPVSQITHLGLIATYAWMPFGFWAIDDLAAERTRAGFLKLIAAFTLGLLAGYPATWAALAVSILAYALARGVLRIPALALALSLGIAAIQLLPAGEAAAVKAFDAKYDRFSGFAGGWPYFLSLFVPNFYDFDLTAPVAKNHGKDFLYLGAFGICGLLFLATRLRQFWKPAWPFAASILACLLFAFNPFGIAGRLIEQSNLLRQTLSAWYFLAGAAPPIAALAALGIESFLQQTTSRQARTLAPAAIAAASLWCAYLLSFWIFRWHPIHDGLASILYTLAGVAIGAALLWCGRAPRDSRWRFAASAAFFILGIVEFKVYGTSKRLNTADGASRTTQNATNFPGITRAALARMREARPARVVLDRTGPDPTDLRHSGLAIPQGFDPLISAAYRGYAERKGTFDGNRLFYLPPDPATLRAFGAKFFITTEARPTYTAMLADTSNFRLTASELSYFKVFELTGGAMPIAFPAGNASIHRWTAASRSLRVSSASGGTLQLTEQSYPGWQALVDNAPANLTPCSDGPFLCVNVAPGEHQVEFRYRPSSLAWGAAISTLAAVLTFLTQRRLATLRQD